MYDLLSAERSNVQMQASPPHDETANRDLFKKNLHDTEPDVLLDAPRLIRLALAISKEFGEYEVPAVPWQALSEESTGLTSALAAKVARMAAESRSATGKKRGPSSHARAPLQSSVSTA